MEAINTQLLENRKKLVTVLDSISDQMVLYNNSSYNRIINPIIDVIKKNTNKDFVVMEGDGIVSFAKDIKIPYTNRIKLPFGKYVKRHVSSSIPDGYLSVLSDYFLGLTISNLQKDLIFRVGKDITEFYKNTKVNSCMTGRYSWSTELYALNPMKVALVTYKDIARALFWTMDDGKFFLDRVYSNSQGIIYAFEFWGAYKNIILFDTIFKQNRKHKMSYNKTHKVTLKCKNYLPYLDTFCFIKRKSKNVAIFATDEVDGSFECNQTQDGFLPWIEQGCFCFDCGAAMPFEYNAYPASKNDYYCEGCTKYLKKCKKCGFYCNHNDIENENENELCPMCAGEESKS